MLKKATIEELLRKRTTPSDDATLSKVRSILNDVQRRGDTAFIEYGERFGDIAQGSRYIIPRGELDAALLSLPIHEQEVLNRTAERIRRFAAAQRSCIRDLRAEVEGGWAGHSIIPLESAACYAPGGRYPLPSSVLMTAVTAKVAGVRTVWIASPKPTRYTLAAAAVAGADALLAIGGAQAVAALAFGTETVPKFDVIVGPGNRWVTAAKQLVAGHVKIDMLAGPSELTIIADAHADPGLIAADLLAQAEHDPDSIVTLVAMNDDLVFQVNKELERQLESLPTRETARAALQHSNSVMASTLEEAAEISNSIAPEHLSLHLKDSSVIRPLLKHYGGLFVGAESAEVMGDYGIGPNHVLPTQGSARIRGGLSVFDFLKIQTWLEMTSPTLAAEDIVSLARIEGLEAHARSMERRMRGPTF